ncbi:hypothetical protein F5144DRAFT_536873 [Chaetomium tenue]|uniref:Uncharacterized protein n=1 Tax=Chaetomium tenue TaxID=1854479 RepID=A0ACB7P405_9PEZI|nr:hypothetical protein F5144DRAFT_536873 [Chaetomium globosum]
MPTPTPPSTEPTRRATALRNLQTLYTNLTLLHTIAAPTIILHPADRDLTTPPRPPLVGIAAAQQHEEDLVEAAGRRGGLVMDVGMGSGGMVVDEGGVFGCVMGVLRGGGSSGDGGVGSGSGAGSSGGERNGGEDARATEGEEKQREGIAMPFCGVWRFDELGRAVEHWENAADPAALGRWLRGE